MKIKSLLSISILILSITLCFGQGTMMYSDTTRLGRPLAKDPHVINWGDYYLMYYSIPSKPDKSGWGIGVARSSDLINWTKVGEITPQANYEAKVYVLLEHWWSRVKCICSIKPMATDAGMQFAMLSLMTACTLNATRPILYSNPQAIGIADGQ